MTTKELENAVIGKLKAEGLSINSNWKDIKKCLSRTVAPTICIATALRLKNFNPNQKETPACL